MNTTTTNETVRARVGWGDLIWLTWRQHRVPIVATTGLVVAVVAAMVWLGRLAGAPDDLNAEVALFGSVRSASQLLVLAPAGFGGLIAVFWAAPLLSREYEQRTHLLVWGQDVTPVRWLLAKVAALGTLAVGLAVAMGAAANTLVHQVNAAAVETEYPPFRLFQQDAFEVAPLVQAGYAAFGFALGMAISAISRRTVLSMGLTLGSYFAVRATVVLMARPYYQTPVHRTEPLKTSGTSDQFDSHALLVESGMADAAGNPVDIAAACLRGTVTSDSFDNCARDNGVVSRYTDYQPADRLVTFQVIEFSIFVLLAVALLVIACFHLRRSDRL